MKKVLPWLFALVGLILLVVSFWLDVHQGSSIGRDSAFAVGIYAMAAALVRFKVVKIPAGIHLPLITSGPRIPDLLKAVISIGLGGVWVYVFGKIADETWWGAALVFGPPLVLMLVAGFFIFRGLGPKESR